MSTVLIKRFLDLCRMDPGSSSWCKRCLSSKVCLNLSKYLMGNGVAFIQPVIIRHVSFSAVVTCFACFNLLHTEQAYSAVDKHIASAVVLKTFGFAPC